LWCQASKASIGSPCHCQDVVAAEPVLGDEPRPQHLHIEVQKHDPTQWQLVAEQRRNPSQ